MSYPSIIDKKQILKTLDNPTVTSLNRLHIAMGGKGRMPSKVANHIREVLPHIMELLDANKTILRIGIPK